MHGFPKITDHSDNISQETSSKIIILKVTTILSGAEVTPRAWEATPNAYGNAMTPGHATPGAATPGSARRHRYLH